MYLEFEDPLDWPHWWMSIVKICKTNTLVTKAQNKRYQPRRKKTPCLLAFNITWCQLANHNQGWKYFAVRKDQVAIQPVTVIHNFLLIHIGEVKYCPKVLLLLWTKITWAVTRKWHKLNQTLSFKPKLAITDITKLKISLKSGYAHLSFNWYLI